MCRGQWTGIDGGNRNMETWLSNPKIKLMLKGRRDAGDNNANDDKKCEVFIGIYIRDSRMTMGADYYKVKPHSDYICHVSS